MMSDEKVMALVNHDGSSDSDEGVGEFGGYVSYYVQGDVLTVRAEARTDEGEAPMEVTSKSWRLVPLDPGDATPATMVESAGPYKVLVYHEGCGELIVTGVTVTQADDPDLVSLQVLAIKPGS